MSSCKIDSILSQPDDPGLKLRLLLVVIIGVTLLISGCAAITDLLERVTSREEAERIELVHQKEDALLAETNKLLELSPEDEPELYRRQRKQFEAALQEYLQAAQVSDDQLVLLNHSDRIIILPIQIVNRGVGESIIQYADSPIRLRQQIGPTFQGEVLDFIQLPDTARQELRLAVLFPDSLVFLSQPGIDSFRTSTYRFPRSDFSIIRSRVKRGVLGLKPVGQSDHLAAVTTSLTSPIIFNVSGPRLTRVPPSPTGNDITYPGNWISVVGQGLFRDPSQNVRAFFGIRDVPGSPHYILLNDTGIPHLLTEQANELVWSGEHALGTRVFPLSQNRVAVTTDSSHTFFTLRYAQDSLELLGQSSEFAHPISAIRQLSLGQSKGIGISICDSGTTPPARSRIEFHPMEDVRWTSVNRYPRLRLPGYQFRFTVLEQQSSPPDTLLPLFETSMHSNIFPTLVSSVGTGTPQSPALTAISPSHNYQVWTVRLRRDLRLPNGERMTAQNVVHSWLTTFQSYGGDSKYSWLWQDITGMPSFLQGTGASPEGLRLVNDFTIQIVLDTPRPQFREHLAHPCFRIYTSLPEYEYPVGFGPFYVTDMQATDGRWSITCQRNRYYYRGMPPLERLMVQTQRQYLPDSLAERRYAGAVIHRKQDVQYFRQMPEYSVQGVPKGQVKFLVLNTQKTPLADPAIRSQILGSLNRTVTANIVDAAVCSPRTGLFGLETHPTTDPMDSIDVSGIRPIDIAYPASDQVTRQIGERLAARLTQIGIPYRIPRAVPDEEFGRLRTSNTYDILVDSYLPEYHDENYNVMQLLQRGYPIPSSIDETQTGTLLNGDSADARSLKSIVADAGIFFPILTAKSYYVIPQQLEDVSVQNSGCLDVSGAWFPRK